MPEHRRIKGYDMARGLAILIMMVINFNCMLSGENSFPVWLSKAVDFMDRRAAVLLVMLAGTGLTLITKQKSMPQSVSPETRFILLKRALFLFLVGYCLTLIWPADILHFYAVFIYLGIFLAKASNRSLIVLAFIFWFTCFIQIIDLFELIQQISIEYVLAGQIMDICFTGYYPVFPWMAFFITGMWLARQDIKCPIFRKWTFVSGILMLIASEIIGRVPIASLAGIFIDPATNFESYYYLYYVIHIMTMIDLNVPTPLSAISGMGSGLCLIIISLWMADHFTERQAAHLVTAGKTSLTFYIGHILVLQTVSICFNLGDIQNILMVISAALGLFLVGIKIMEHWLVKHSKGPFETIMRRFPFGHQGFGAARQPIR